MQQYYAPTPGKTRLPRMLRALGVCHTDDLMDDWDLYLPGGGKNLIDQLRALLPARIDQWIGALPGSYWISNKANLWELLRQAGPEPAALMPETWLVRRPADWARLQAAWAPGTQLILKDPTRQRRQGLRLCGDLGAVQPAAAEGFLVAQRLAGDLRCLGGRRFHLRLYVLVLRLEGRFTFWLHRHGRVIYAPAPASADVPEAWVTRSVGSHEIPAGLPFTVAELDPDMAPIEALLGTVAQVTAPRLRAAWSLGCNPAHQFFGADIMLREGGGAYVVELNKGPDMRAKCARDDALKDAVVADVLAAMGVSSGGEWPGGFRQLSLPTATRLPSENL